MEDVNIQRDEMCKESENLNKKDDEEGLRTHLLHQCQCLGGEIKQFEEYLVEQGKENSVEVRIFKAEVKAQLKSLEELSRADPSSERTLASLKGSTLPYHIAVWNTAKHCTGIIAIRRSLYWLPDEYSNGRTRGKGVPLRPSNHSTMVDIIAQGGAEWVKISNINQKRILEMAKLSDPDGILRQMEVLVKLAARAPRVRYKQPKVLLVLTRIQKSGEKLVEDFILQVQALGVTVMTSQDLTSRTSLYSMISPEPGDLFSMLKIGTSLSAIFQRMVTDSFDRLSKTINVDCRILLALVSDNSNGRVEAEDWHDSWVSCQIKLEKQTKLLPRLLWPVMEGRQLLCTYEAAKRMHDIIDGFGTKSEKIRRDCLMEVESTAHLSRKQRIEAFRELSSYEVPLDWNIPIKVVKPELATLLKRLPPAAESLSDLLTPLNQSVFLYGWAEGMTTVSGSRNVAKAIEKTLETYPLGEDDEGPEVWLIPAPKSLLGYLKR